MAKDTGIITIYDTHNNGAPLLCHRIDARDALAHPSGRWSAEPIGSVEVAAPTEDDTGEAMKFKEMSFKTLQGMANKAGIDARDIRKMNKAALIDALLKK